MFCCLLLRFWSFVDPFIIASFVEIPIPFSDYFFLVGHCEKQAAKLDELLPA